MMDCRIDSAARVERAVKRVERGIGTALSAPTAGER